MTPRNSRSAPASIVGRRLTRARIDHVGPADAFEGRRFEGVRRWLGHVVSPWDELLLLLVALAVIVSVLGGADLMITSAAWIPGEVLGFVMVVGGVIFSARLSNVETSQGPN